MAILCSCQPRSPICRLIVSEDLWALMDALQQPVPEEVDQHLENIHTSSTPLMVRGRQGASLACSLTQHLAAMRAGI